MRSTMPRSDGSLRAGGAGGRRSPHLARSAGSKISRASRRGWSPEAGRGMAPQRKTFPRLFATRAEPLRLIGDPVFLRPPERGDYDSWANLRARSRNFLAPWEPTWPPDALSRTSFRGRIGRYSEDWRGDQGYNFFIFQSDETLVGLKDEEIITLVAAPILGVAPDAAAEAGAAQRVGRPGRFPRREEIARAGAQIG